MAEGGHLTPTVSSTHVETVDNSTNDKHSHSPNVVLKLRKPKNDRKVSWTADTIDNELMEKKKSKCCCIYDRPKMFGESSDEEDDNCTGHCHGHKKKCYRTDPPDPGDGREGSTDEP